VASWSTKEAISLKHVKIEEKLGLLWRAYRKSSTLFRFFGLPPYFYFRLRLYSHQDGCICHHYDLVSVTVNYFFTKGGTRTKSRRPILTDLLRQTGQGPLFTTMILVSGDLVSLLKVIQSDEDGEAS